MLACFGVAVISSWHLLGEPNLRPGIPAPFEAIAPKNALVKDSEALQQKRSNLIPRTSVQIIDKKESIFLILIQKKKKYINFIAMNTHPSPPILTDFYQGPCKVY